jgi:DNA-binding protein HU-beta
MKKPELFNVLADSACITPTQAKNVINALGDIITRQLLSGQDVTIHGVGKLVITTRAARTARNPKTGEQVAVPARQAVKFRPSAALKAAI